MFFGAGWSPGSDSSGRFGTFRTLPTPADSADDQQP